MKAFGYGIGLAILLQSGHAWALDVDPAPFISLQPVPAAQDSAAHAPAPSPDASALFAARLKLRPDQKAAYDAWRASGAPDPATRAADDAQRQQALDSTPHFYAYLQAHMLRDLDNARRQSAAINAFYAVLNPEQRLIFDKAMLSPMGAPPAPPSVPQDDDAPDAKPNYLQAGRTNPDWLSQPNGYTFAAFYPSRAQREEVEGAATVKCTVTRQGVAMDCKIVSESPDGYGFGNATVEIASYFRFRPATVHGVPVEGVVTVPMSWKLADDDAFDKTSDNGAQPAKRTP